MKEKVEILTTLMKKYSFRKATDKELMDRTISLWENQHKNIKINYMPNITKEIVWKGLSKNKPFL